MNRDSIGPDRSRGAQSNPHNRFAARRSEPVDDGWPGDRADQEPSLDTATRSADTQAMVDRSRTIVTDNDSPDVPFSSSINPYKGCEHGCIYCYARPTHEYLDLSLGRDFETRLFYKPDAVAQLKAHLDKPGYRCRTIALGANTDPYQPLEREKRLTRGILETLLEYRHPVSIVTKGNLILRDLDLLAELQALDLVRVAISVTTLDNELKRIMEPRASAPATRLKVVRRLREQGIPVGVLLAPVIPCINDHELEDIVAASVQAGAQSVDYVMLRLPWQLRELFTEWLGTHFAQRRERVLNRLRDLRGGDLYRGGFGSRMTGEGIHAELIAQRFAIARRRYGLDASDGGPLRTDLFRVPGRAEQLGLPV